MKLPRPDLATLVVCATALVGIILLAALRLPIPSVLEFVALGALTGGTGIALNTPNGRETLPPRGPAPAPARTSAAAPAPRTPTAAAL